MSTILMTKTEEATGLTTRILSDLFDDEALRRIRFRLWDGTYWPDDSARPVTLVLKHPGALRSMFLPGTEVGLGEAYIYDDFDIEGEIQQIFSISDNLIAATSGLSEQD